MDSYLGCCVPASVRDDREHPYFNTSDVVWVRCVTLPTEVRDLGDTQSPPLDHYYCQALEREG